MIVNYNLAGAIVLFVIASGWITFLVIAGVRSCFKEYKGCCGNCRDRLKTVKQNTEAIEEMKNNKQFNVSNIYIIVGFVIMIILGVIPLLGK